MVREGDVISREGSEEVGPFTILLERPKRPSSELSNKGEGVS